MKKLSIILLLALIALAAAGCFGDQANNADNVNNEDKAANEEGSASNETAGGHNEDAGSEGSDNTGTVGGEEPGQDGGEQQLVGADTAQAAASAVIATLKDKDLDTLKRYIHPDKGILFAPYVHVDTDTALSFAAGELPDLNDDTVYTWGSYDGSGEPIEMTFAQYYDRFVYNQDFAAAEQIGMDEIKGSGNTVSNIKEVFPGSYLVDYYFSGFDPQYEGMDWESLILVLEEHESRWYIRAVVHNQWTI